MKLGIYVLSVLFAISCSSSKKDNPTYVPSTKAIPFSSCEEGNFLNEELQCEELTEEIIAEKTWHLDFLFKNGASYPTGQGVRVYVLDSIFYEDHYDISDSIVYTGIDFLSIFKESENIDLLDRVVENRVCYSHGTRVSSIFVSRYSGLSRDVEIVPVSLGCDSENWVEAFIDSLEWIENHISDGKRSVINMSLALDDFSESEEQVIHATLSRLVDKGVFLVSGGGNLIRNPFDENWDKVSVNDVLPARLDSKINGLLTVGAIQKDLEILTSSVKDAPIFAPGHKILSSSFAYKNYFFPVFGEISHTSSASPMVAAIAALILERFPEITPGEIEDMLLSNALTHKTKDGRSIKILQVPDLSD